MVFIPTPNAVTASIRYLWDNQQVENTLSFARTTAWDEPTMETLGNILLNWRTTQLRALQPVNLVLQEVYIVDQASEDAPAITVVADPGTAPGTVNSSSLPNNVTLAIQFRTALRGRSGRGRNFLLGLTEGQVVNNLVDQSVRNAYQGAYETLEADLESVDAYHVVISKYSNKQPRPNGVIRRVTAYTYADGSIDSQRRRLPGRGA